MLRVALLFGIFTLIGHDVALGAPTGGMRGDAGTEAPKADSGPCGLMQPYTHGANTVPDIKQYLDDMRNMAILLGRMYGYDFRVSDDLIFLKYIGRAYPIDATVRHSNVVNEELNNAISVDASINSLKQTTWWLFFAYYKDTPDGALRSETVAGMKDIWIINKFLQDYITDLSPWITLERYASLKIRLMTTMGCEELNSNETKKLLQALFKSDNSLPDALHFTEQDMRTKLEETISTIENDAAWSIFHIHVLSNLADRLCNNHNSGDYGRFYDPTFSHYEEFRAGISRWHRLYTALHSHNLQMEIATQVMQAVLNWLRMENMNPEVSRIYMMLGETLNAVIPQFIWSDKEMGRFELQINEIQREFQDMIAKKNELDNYPSFDIAVKVHKKYFVDNTFNKDPIFHLLMIHYYSELKSFEEYSRSIAILKFMYARKIRKFPRLPNSDEEMRRLRANRLYDRIEMLSENIDAHMREMHFIMQFSTDRAATYDSSDDAYSQNQKTLEANLHGLRSTYAAMRTLIIDYLVLLCPDESEGSDADYSTVVQSILPDVTDSTLRAFLLADENLAAFIETATKARRALDTVASIPLASSATRDSACYRELDSRNGHMLSQRYDLHFILNRIHIDENDKRTLEFLYQSLAGEIGSKDHKNTNKAFKLFLDNRVVVQRALQLDIAMPRIRELTDQFVDVANTFRPGIHDIAAGVERCEAISAEAEFTERMADMYPDNTS
ncbi:acyl-phosphate:glycerol-3-phosphate O-acyltransferase, putative [Babesia ovata]|uniref:Acyl-phosphate:glycerol-3-phosphate O-acyltransferase, putative n=1 Tax=Babesia ovata TaxID=189622 RepID=A0A2H6K9G1_9APIC|nr:acyl-phosphate:glycerol-3-phosphate O-acyltransferase, putative [Babesia ovata]GBE59642.1 acyl-phosphate:glycerol-3-phosphate O-acyltransferase, putative [Babesia ovata]